MKIVNRFDNTKILFDSGGTDLRDVSLRNANLYDADLRNANLYDADLRNANLRDANLRDADLRGADLRDADLCDANLRGADLRNANLRDANLRDADLRGADLRDADLCDANLRGADLRGADLRGAKIDDLQAAILSIVPEAGPFEGWKKCCGGVIVRLEILANARRSNATGRKCRAEQVRVIEVIGDVVGVSIYRSNIEYRAGEIVSCDRWEEDRWTECGGGIHFYITRIEAENHS
jgi:uncharacterized protein YjbI with pentapeptide repeats